MARTRHRRADHARRIVRSTAALAGTVAAVVAAAVVIDPVTTLSGATAPAAAPISVSAAPAEVLQTREEAVTRSAVRRAAVPPAREIRFLAEVKRDAAQAALRAQRLEAEQAATRRAIRMAETRLWTTEDLNLWTAPGESARGVGLIEAGERVLVTGRRKAGREELVLEGLARWVSQGYLSEEKPVVGVGGECTNGTSVPSGVSPNIALVHQAVCSAFPEITVYGTFRGDGEHAMGLAVDIMVSGSRGWEVAEFVRANYAALGVNYVIYSQSIWSLDRGGEGWRGMSDRGSTTANHYDHVHVTTY